MKKYLPEVVDPSAAEKKDGNVRNKKNVKKKLTIKLGKKMNIYQK